MSAILLEGPKIAAAIREEIAAEGARLTAEGHKPGLAVVLAGHDPASEIYVRNKVKGCEELGFYSELIRPDDDATTEDLLKIVADLNARDEIDGILVQMPLPKGLDTKRILLAIDPLKDVDGLHPINVGNLSTQRPALAPCTPSGCMEILQRSGIAISGAEAVVVGRSDLMGKPMAMLLTNANATVTICHSRTRDLAEVCRRADILVAAIGQPGFIDKTWIKPGAAVLDVGINRIDDRASFDKFFAGNEKREAAFAKRGSVIVGDVHPNAVEVAGYLTPVPGGVGVLTIVMLMANTLKAAKLRRGKQ